jgi:hypothetical protein
MRHYRFFGSFLLIWSLVSAKNAQFLAFESALHFKIYNPPIPTIKAYAQRLPLK